MLYVVVLWRRGGGPVVGRAKQIYEEYVPLGAALKKHTELLLDHLEEKGDWLVRHRASWQQAQLVARLQSGRRARELVEELESLSRRARELVEAR